MKTNELITTIREAINRPAEPVIEKQNAIDLLNNDHLISVDTDYPPTQCIVEVNGVGLFSKGNIHAIKAKQKSGKTTATSIITAAALGATGFSVRQTTLIDDERKLFCPRILFFDTEQNPADTQLQYQHVLDWAGLPRNDAYDRLRYYNFRTLDRNHSLENIKLLVETYQPDAVFIDGIVDLLGDFNDITSSQNLIQELMTLASVNNCAVINILHTNKDQEDHNMRGHLGTMLAQKADVVLECTHQANVFKVTCSDSRHQPVPTWSFMFNLEGQVIDAESELKRILDDKKQEAIDKRQAKSQELHKDRLDFTLDTIRKAGGVISRSNLVMAIRTRYSLHDSSANAILKQFREQGYICERDKQISIAKEQPSVSQSTLSQD